MKSTANRYRFLSGKSGNYTILEGVDEESRTYSTVFKGPFEKCRKKLQNLSLKDVPLEIRRREAKKLIYLVRYE